MLLRLLLQLMLRLPPFSCFISGIRERIKIRVRVKNQCSLPLSLILYHISCSWLELEAREDYSRMVSCIIDPFLQLTSTVLCAFTFLL